MSETRFHVYLRKPPNAGQRAAARQLIKKYKHLSEKDLDIAMEEILKRPATRLWNAVERSRAWALWQECCDMGLAAQIRPVTR